MSVSAALEIVEETTKYCTGCKQTKPLSDYYSNKARSDGHANYCKDCAKRVKDDWRKTPEGKKKHNAQYQRWRSENRDRYLACARETDKARNHRPFSPNKTIKCSSCGVVGGISLFSPSKLARGSGRCKKCERKRKAFYDKQQKTKPKKYNFKHLTGNLYTVQIYSSRDRGHPKPPWTLHELREWIVKQPHFNRLVEEWIVSEFDPKKKPTIDRINPMKPYTWNNIQLMTVRENMQKGRTDFVLIYQFVREYYSKGPKTFQKQVNKLFQKGETS